MILFHKTQFNLFVGFALDELKTLTTLNIKRLKFSNCLARALGFNSHNHLLASLPYELPYGDGDIAASDRALFEILRREHGIVTESDAFFESAKNRYYDGTSLKESANPELFNSICLDDISSMGAVRESSPGCGTLAFFINKEKVPLYEQLQFSAIRHIEFSKNDVEQYMELLDALIKHNPNNELVLGYKLLLKASTQLPSQSYINSYHQRFLDSMPKLSQEEAISLHRSFRSLARRISRFMGGRKSIWASYAHGKDAPIFDDEDSVVNISFWPALLYWESALCRYIESFNTQQ